jgi:hypothetical protein
MLNASLAEKLDSGGAGRIPRASMALRRRMLDELPEMQPRRLLHLFFYKKALEIG